MVRYLCFWKGTVMRNMLNVTRMSSADAVAVNEKTQVAVADAVSTYGEAIVTAPVIDAAAGLQTVTSSLEQIEVASFEERREVDTGADRCLGTIINCCESTITAYESAVVSLSETQQQSLDAADWLLSRCFPFGRGFIIGRWSEQFGVTELILKTAAQTEARPHIERLGLVDLFDLLQRTHAVYGEKMGFTALKATDTESPLYLWHEALESYLGAVIYAHNKNAELKEKLTTPYESIARAVRDANRRPPKTPEAETPEP